MKTIQQHLQDLPDCTTKERALNNMWKDYSQEWSKSLPQALKRAFLWSRSPEGFLYWKQVHEELEKIIGL